MAQAEFTRLLKSVQLLDQIADKPLSALAEFLKPVDFADGAVVFEEGSQGDSVYFVLSGKVRVSKKVAGAVQDLALLGPGDSAGEMALLETVARSATCTAVGQTRLLKLARADMSGWLQTNPSEAVEFFSELAQVQSKRLRATSSELTLLSDLSSVLLETSASPAELLRKAMGRLLPHLPGTWTASAYLFNPYNGETELACGPAVAQPKEDDSTFVIPLPGLPRARGFLVLHSAAPLSDKSRSDLSITLTTSARLLSAALENLNHRLEEALRARLRSSSHGKSI
jgi:CRP/FNR family transcriptional regulator